MPSVMPVEPKMLNARKRESTARLLNLALMPPLKRRSPPRLNQFRKRLPQ